MNSGRNAVPNTAFVPTSTNCAIVARVIHYVGA